MTNRRIIFTSSNLMQANLVKSLLEDNDILVFLYDDTIARLHFLYKSVVGGIKLVVGDPQFERARDILREYIGQGRKHPDFSQKHPSQTISRTVCPKCYCTGDAGATYCDRCGTIIND